MFRQARRAAGFSTAVFALRGSRGLRLRSCPARGADRCRHRRGAPRRDRRPGAVHQLHRRPPGRVWQLDGDGRSLARYSRHDRAIRDAATRALRRNAARAGRWQNGGRSAIRNGTGSTSPICRRHRAHRCSASRATSPGGWRKTRRLASTSSFVAAAPLRPSILPPARSPAGAPSAPPRAASPTNAAPTACMWPARAASWSRCRRAAAPPPER